MPRTESNSPPFANESTWYALVRLMRPRQWIKNVFVFAPLVFAGRFVDMSSLVMVGLTFLLFCMASSAAYIINDWRDMDSDRRHPHKCRTRPLAAGHVTPRQAFVLLGGLYGLMAVLLWYMPTVLLPVGAYLLLNLAYSFYLKHQPVLDIFSIAAGFVLRVVAGAAVLQVPLSSWMLVTTLALALYLASIKRRQELAGSGEAARQVLQRYSVALVDRYAEMSATGAIVFYSLFVMDSRPELIATIPLVLFGLFRYWYVVDAKDQGESPTDALLGDGFLMATVCLWIA
ncbi:MAG: decaprenyl-phosphate phosphoribosyltransferase, partial [Gammaproteobacteria bacterium]|nr:decaprenyl-phosphate phosphoribosyltransferase [Gammaproteobacteria bacterium]